MSTAPRLPYAGLRVIDITRVLASPYTTYQLLAFSAFELHKYDEALAACEKAISYPGSPPDLARLHEGIQDAIKQQAAEKAAAESERRSL